MSRKLEDLHWYVKDLAEELLLKVKEKLNLNIIIYFTIRTFQEQNEIYAQGRTKPGKIVTNAKGGQSYHNFGLAFDLAVLKPNKTIDWNQTADINDDDLPDYDQIGEIAEDMGLEWGKRFTNLAGDFGHFQVSFGFKIKELLAFYNKGGMDLVNEQIHRRIEDGLSQ